MDVDLRALTHVDDDEPEDSDSDNSLYTHTDVDEVKEDSGGDAKHTHVAGTQQAPSLATHGKSKASGQSIYQTARSNISTFVTARSNFALDPKGARTHVSEYTSQIQAKGLQESLFDETNWSGGGQHVEFKKFSRAPNSLLKWDKDLGHGAAGVVQRVLCRRVYLARKTMIVQRKETLGSLLNEVKFLQELNHPHIVRLVGTYLQGRHFSMLMYPAASMNLAELLEMIEEQIPAPNYFRDEHLFMRDDATYIPGCLSHALEHIHSKNIVHHDVKPSNVLIHWPRVSSQFLHYDFASRAQWNGSGYFQDTTIPETSSFWPLRVYLCDFGLSRDFTANAKSQTGTAPGMTGTYAAPEVANHDQHGRAADIFSLGCVFLEIATVLSGDSLDNLTSIRAGHGEPHGGSFHANHAAVAKYLETLEHKRRTLAPIELYIPPLPLNLLETIKRMMALDPAKRPTAAELCTLIPSSECCEGPREDFVTADANQ